MKKIILTLIAIAVSSVSYADCPAIDTIHQTIGHPNNWQAPWYEGLTENDIPLDKITQFVQVCWYNYFSDQEGVVFCDYNSKNGKKVEFVQNSYDVSVKRPTGPNWQPSSLPRCTLVCIGTQEQCGFKDYPPASLK